MPDELRNLPVIIASKTEDHISDLEFCLKTSPSKIFIEKGFLDNDQKLRAKELIGEVPCYIMSQYRYSAVFDRFLSYNLQIEKCYYNWKVNNNSGAREWFHNILSIDNYLKRTNNSLYADKFGTYEIDHISSARIAYNQERSLLIDIDTKEYQAHFDLGKTNKLYLRNKLDGVELQFFVSDEDCLRHQIKDIMTGQNIKLEKL